MEQLTTGDGGSRSVMAARGCALLALLALLPASSTHRYDVVIVGGGAAGLAAARRLIQNGVTNLTILEARHRLGGRIHTTSFGGEVVDLGAQYIYANDGNAVYDLMKDLDESYNPPKRNTRLLTPGALPLDKNIINYLMTLKPIEVSRPNETFGEYFIPRFKEFMKERGVDEKLSKAYLDTVRKLFSVHHGGDISEVGAWGVLKYRESSHGRSAQWKSGYQTLLHILLGIFGKDSNEVDLSSKIQLGKEVSGVEWEGEGVKVRCSDGSEQTGQVALVTLPLGVLKNASPTLFQPPLPKQKILAIQHIGFGTVNKIFLDFDNEVTNGEKTIFGMSSKMKKKFVRKEQKGFWPTKLTGFCPTRDSSKLLNLWIVGENAKIMEQLSDVEVIDGCVSMMKHILGREVPLPKAILRSKWGTDKFSLGSYSYRSAETETNNVTHEDLAQPLYNSAKQPVVLFAGEATHKEHYGTVHGAVESGYREAQRILQEGLLK